MVEVTRAEIGVDTSDLAAGKIALDSFTAAGVEAQKAADGLSTASNRAKNYGTQVGKASQHTANLAAQFNDIGVMLAAGQSPLQLALQQGTQINQVFAQLGGGRGAIRALGAALMQIISPLSLLTIGLIAGGAALFQWGRAALDLGDTAKKARQALDDLVDTIGEYERHAGVARTTSKELREEFGAVADEVKRVAEFMQTVSLQRAMSGLGGALDPIREDLSEIANAGDATAEALARVEKQYADGVATFEQLFNAKEAFETITALADESAEKLGLTTGQAKELNAAIKQIQGADGMAGVRQGAADVLALLEKITDSGGRLTPEMQAVAVSMEEVYRAALNADDSVVGTKQATDAWADAMAGVRAELDAIGAALAAIGGGAITAAAKQAEISILRAGGSLKEAALAGKEFKQNLEIEAQVTGLESRFGAVGKIIGGFVKGQAEYNQELDRTLETERESARERERESRRGGRGGGGAKANKEFQTDLESLVKDLQTERQIQDAWYEEGQAILADRRAKELLGEEEHKLALQALENTHSAELIRIKMAEASHIRDAQRSLYSELGSLLTAFGSKNKAAAVAAIALNTYLRATEASQNTAAAIMRAYAELGPIAGSAAAAKIATLGKLQVAAIIAGGAVQAGSALSGGGGGAGGSGGTTGPGVDTVDQPRVHRILVEGLDQNTLYTGAQIQRLVGAIQEEFDNQGLELVFK